MMVRIFILLLLTMFGIARAEDGSAVVVIYNSKMPASKSLADYYAEKRNVPSDHLIGLPLPEKETISREDYRKNLVEPLLKKLADGKLMTFAMRTWTNTANEAKESLLVKHSKVRYAALCFGVPVKIEQDDSIIEPNPEKLPAITIRNEAAVDSELSLLPMHHAKLSLNGPIGNRMYATTNRSMLHPTNGVLMVTRLDGPTVEIARGLIDKALQAEKDGLWGRAYFDTRGLTNGEYKIGDDMIRACEKTAARIGFETLVDDLPGVFLPSFPMPQIGLYVGWYEHNVAGALAYPTVEFIPGAFAYHLHSWSAEFVRNPTERWVGPLLARGATCTMGTVYEPFLQGTPDIAVFLGRWLFEGATFAEAACSGQRMLSWQTTVIGDPLYRPMGRKPQQRHEELEAAKSKLIEWSWLRFVNINLATALPPQQVITFLRERPETKTSAILSEKLADLLNAKGDWSGASECYERALKLNPTPQQRLKITFTLAPMLNNLGRGRDAYALYQGLIRDYPQYPDPLQLYRKIVPLAQQHGKPDEAAEYNRMVKELTPKT
ncbi:MAG TPA: TIGR03790 family protein [Verrucomicrobiae bacterium]|nr:TIGR03790 family protein [Verrucomicrobiae bacterium]